MVREECLFGESVKLWLLFSTLSTHLLLKHNCQLYHPPTDTLIETRNIILGCSQQGEFEMVLKQSDQINSHLI